MPHNLVEGKLAAAAPMTFAQTYHIQFSFHFDETQRLLALAHTLPEDVRYAKINYSHDSMHNTFVHLLGASRFWRTLIANTTEPHSEETIAEIDALAAMVEIERKGWRELLATFDTETLLGTIERQSPWGVLVLPIWQTLQHVILHGMAHHTELARMLTDAGQAPGDIDFLLYQATA